MKTARSGMLSGIRVLVVDDQPDDRDALVQTHGTLGAEVDGVDSAVEALRALSESSYDVLVSDLRMLPPPDGFELIRRVRAGEAGAQRIPAIAVTRYGGTYCYRALEAGYQSCLSKPVNPESLAEIILRLTKRGNM